MKRYSRWIMALIAACCLLQSGHGQAFAGSLYFEDDTVVFPGYTGPPGSNSTDDCIVGPEVTGMTVNWDDNGYLTSIVISLDTTDYLNWNSLFINSNGGSKWDDWNYFVHGGGPDDELDPYAAGGAVPGDGLYAVKANYTYTTEDRYSDREEHVNGIALSSLTSLASGFQGTLAGNSSSGYTLTYDFASLSTKILLGDDFVIGFSEGCANDVMLAYANGQGPGPQPGPVPEPATMILFGTGLASLAGWSHYRKK